MMLHVSTGNCLCVSVKIEHTKGAALLPMFPPDPVQPGHRERKVSSGMSGHCSHFLQRAI